MRLLAGVALALAVLLSSPGPGSAAPAPEWRQVGPAPIRVPPRFQQGDGLGPNSGQVTSIALDPSGSRDQVVYAATNDSGVWRSADGGGTWRTISDALPSLSMGAVALDPSNPSVVYAGTGTGHDPGLTFWLGLGLFRSADGGRTWSQLGAHLFDQAGIVSIAVAPSNLLVATSRGIFRSVDGGAHFGSDPPGFANGQAVVKGNALDLRLDTASPSTVYASVYGLGLIRSTDAGVTFPTTLLAAKEGLIFAQSTLPDSRTIYAAMGDGPQSWRLMRSTDGGGKFGAVPASLNGVANGVAADDNGCSCILNRTIGVDPRDPSRLYVAFRELYGSLDGGATFTNVSRGKIHWDHHALAFSPRAHWGAAGPTRLYVGTDGGIATTADGGQTFVNLNEGIASVLFYGVDFGRGSATSNGYVYGGAQDNGVLARRPSDPGLDWGIGRPGDGGPAAVDPNYPQRAYSSYVGLSPPTIFVTNDGGLNWISPAPLATGPQATAASEPDDPGPVHTFPRIAVDPASGSPGRVSSLVYLADRTKLYRATNANQGAEYQVGFAPIRTFTSAITALAIGSRAVWVGLVDGSVWRSTDAASSPSPTWTSVAITGRSTLPVGSLAVDQDHVAVGYYDAGPAFPANPAQHLFLSDDGGVAWRDASAGLPELTINAAVFVPGTGPGRPPAVVVGNTAGVLRSVDGGRTWAPLGTELPALDVTSLVYDPATSVLLAGTYGRGAFELTLLAAAPPAAPGTEGRPGPLAGVPLRWVATGIAAGGLLFAAVLVLATWRRRRRPG